MPEVLEVQGCETDIASKLTSNVLSDILQLPAERAAEHFAFAFSPC